MAIQYALHLVMDAHAWPLVLTGFALLSSASSADGPGFVGASRCGVCHPRQFAAQSRSGHAAALLPAGAHPAARSIIAKSFRENGFRYGFVQRDAQLLFQVGRGGKVREQVVDWAFGAGGQAVTFVSRLNEDLYVELRVSYYSSGAQLALTPGHQNHRPDNLESALGVEYKTFSPRSEILSCFGCHSTGPITLGSSQELLPGESGVRCEACHGAGRKHVELAAQGNLDAARKATGNPARLSASELMAFCGECHRPPAAGGAIDWSDAWNVRHQPMYLTRSACFQRSSEGLSCLLCHNPHEPLRRGDAAYYDARCASCHTAERRPPARVCHENRGCASCHMPRVVPQPGLAFHNHWIGVYARGNSLRPQR